MPSRSTTPPPSPGLKKGAMASDDDHTLYSDGGSIYSRSNASSSSFVSYNSYDELPTFRLPKTDGKKEVYEAWTVYLSRDYDEPIFARKLCGIPTVRDYDSWPGVVSSISELHDQKELADMHLKSIEKYNSKHKRTWPSRLVRGTAQSYEDDIDARIRKLPNPVQSEICRLLADREGASSNRFHNRAWTVVHMQEQLHRRFAASEPKVIDKRHRVRFWKNPGKNDRSEYFIVVRGCEGRHIADPVGQTEYKRFENPWLLADESEARRKTREELDKARKRRDKETVTFPPPSYRYTPPMTSGPPPPPAPNFQSGCMYSGPGAYSRPAGGAMSDPTRGPIGIIPTGPRPNPYARPYLPPVPTPPMSYPPPPLVQQHMRGTSGCFGGAPKYPDSVPVVPASMPSYASKYGGPWPPPPRPTNSFGSSYSAPYTFSCNGGPSNIHVKRDYSVSPPPRAPPVPGNPYGYPGTRPGYPLPSMMNSTAYGNVPTSAARQGEDNQHTTKEIDDYLGELCGNGVDDDSDASSIRSWVWRTRDQRVDEVEQKKMEKSNKEVYDASSDPAMTAYRKQLDELAAANKRRLAEGRVLEGKVKEEKEDLKADKELEKAVEDREDDERVARREADWTLEMERLIVDNAGRTKVRIAEETDGIVH